MVARCEGSSLPPSATSPDSAHARLAKTKVKEWRGKGKEQADTLKRWDEGWEVPFGEEAASIHSLEMFADLKTRVTTPLLKKMPELVCVERAFPPQDVAPTLGLDDTPQLLTSVLGAGEEQSDLSTLSAALKTKLRLSNLMKPPPTMSPGVELLTRDVKS